MVQTPSSAEGRSEQDDASPTSRGTSRRGLCQSGIAFISGAIAGSLYEKHGNAQTPWTPGQSTRFADTKENGTSTNPRYEGALLHQTIAEEENAKSVQLTPGETTFTTDWISDHVDSWKERLGHLENVQGAKGLEIGSFEGRSAIWFVQNIFTGKDAQLTCIDLFDPRLSDFFDHNTHTAMCSEDPSKPVAEKIRKIKSPSQLALQALPKEEHGTYDFGYVDGSHIAHDALEDMCHTWPLLKDGGIMIVDDYGWTSDHPDINPKVAVDAFIALHAGTGRLAVIEISNQAVLRKMPARL